MKVLSKWYVSRSNLLLNLTKITKPYDKMAFATLKRPFAILKIAFAILNDA